MHWLLVHFCLVTEMVKLYSLYTLHRFWFVSTSKVFNILHNAASTTNAKPANPDQKKKKKNLTANPCVSDSGRSGLQCVPTFPDLQGRCGCVGVFDWIVWELSCMAKTLWQSTLERETLISFTQQLTNPVNKFSFLVIKKLF